MDLGSAGLQASLTARSSRQQSPRLEGALPIVVLAWLCGVVMLSLRLIGGWLWVQRMTSHGTRPAREAWQLIASRLARRLHIARSVTVLESTRVDVPTVIGWIAPVVLLPASALSGLAPHQLEAILAHELAHIRRHDYFVNLLQTLVETLLFYHPAVWWLSRRIRIERENCCDDLAVSLCGDPVAYAQALADLEERRGEGHEFVMAANGGSLVLRVRRLLGAPNHAGRAPGWLAGAASVVVMVAIAISVVQTSAFAPDATQPVDSDRARLLLHGRAMSVAAREGQLAVRQVHVIARQLVNVLNRARLEFAPQIPPIPPVPPEPPTPANPEEPAPPPTPPGSPSAIEPPVPPEPPVAVVAFQRTAESHATTTYQNNGEKLEVRYDGSDLEFTDDDLDVKRLSPGGQLRIRSGGFLSGLFTGRTVEFSADGSGNITRRYWVGSSERPFEPEGRQWLAQVLPRFIRQTGIGAPARVARILKNGGAAGVLAEISRIEGSWAKRVYFNELLRTQLDPATTRQVLVQAGREIDSDFELASLLIQSADKLLVDEAARQAYFEAARTIQSDFEMHRVYAAALNRGPVSAALLASLLDASRDIDSDFEKATLLIQVARLQPLDNTTRGPFFDALATVSSDFEHRRVLSALAERTNLSPDATAAMLSSAGNIHSDSELASFLLQIVKRQPVEGTLRAPFFRAVDAIASAFERGRVLQGVARRSDASSETVLEVLRATKGVTSNHEASTVLLAVASTHAISGPARDVYVDVAEKLGDFEQGRALSALVRSERRHPHP
jgi:beta-lactamase regulating signal transducer with metallopeptidase domain